MIVCIRLCCVVVATALLMPPLPARAHAVDEYGQIGYLALAPDHAAVEWVMTPGLLVANDVLGTVDADGNGAVSPSEAERYALRVIADHELLLNGARVPLSLQRIEFPDRPLLLAGAGSIRVFAGSGRLNLPDGAYSWLLQSRHEPVRSTHQAVLLAPASDALRIASQQYDETAQALRVAVIVGATSVQAVTAADAGSATVLDQIIGTLKAPSATMLPWIFLASLLLGGLHALTPGHGKTVVAAYLVGSRGTIRHAFALGGIVTFTHTASVIALGICVLMLNQYLTPERLLPWLEMASGLLVFALGVHLVVRRIRGAPHTHHGHEHTHEHDHPHDCAAHEHAHSHAIPQKATFGQILTMGVSGGMVPCPEALGILLVSIGFNQLMLGLGVIVAFSLGLAAVLIAIGVLLVRANGMLTRATQAFGGSQRLLPVISAVAVAVLGLWMLARSMAHVISQVDATAWLNQS